MDGYTPIFWHWWIFAVGLIILEVFAPGTFFLWMGAAAALTGFALWAVPDLPWEWQALMFAVLSVAAIVIARPWIQRQNEAETDQPLLNKRGHQYVGRQFTLTKAIENGVGQIKVDDTLWKVAGEDTPIGETVTVVDVEGTVLRVDKV